MTEKEMWEFVDKCYDELEKKQKIFSEKYNINSYKDFWWEQKRRILQFKNGDVVGLEFKIVFVGTWVFNKNEWLWGWANNSHTDLIKKEASKIKKLYDLTGYDVFLNEFVEADETMAYELTAMAVHQLNAIGIYKSPGEQSHAFFAIIKEN